VLALAQHYGLPSHGLDVTTSDDIAVWFATSEFRKDPTSGAASYARLHPDEWGSNPSEWPIVVVCQIVTTSIEGSLHDCEELRSFGLGASRPVAQSAKFFQGGHSDHQNRLAEAVVCIFRLAPGEYHTDATFETLFPPPGDDPAYRALLEFAEYPGFSNHWGKFVNNFHKIGA
jgi:FRG domain